VVRLGEGAGSIRNRDDVRNLLVPDQEGFTDSQPWGFRTSYLANLLFTYELQSRLAAAGAQIAALAAHPGNARAELWRTTPRFTQKLYQPGLRMLTFWFAQSAEMGSLGRTLAYAERAMPRPGNSERGDRYHHGDLRAALIDTAVQLVGERGVRGFSMAEASRRLGVAVSAPYAHFADRDDLLAAVAVRAFEFFYAALVNEAGERTDPADRLTTMARAYVRFAATRRPLFEVLYEAGLDKARHPEIEAAELAAERAARATRALLTSRQLLGQPALPAS
jgi:AcrR family transcriptional regulator